jgi:hypothetical protein
VNRIVVRVDGAGPSTLATNDKAIDLWTRGDKRNVLVEPDEVVRTFLAEVSPRCRDLLRIAGAIYAADARVTRGRITDAFNDAWRRSFVFHIGVNDGAFWESQKTLNALRSALEFLSGDSIEFSFSKASAAAATARQSLLPTDLGMSSFREANVVILLSGGLDSLAATLQARGAGLRPLLVSHRSAPQIQARQENVVNLLRARDPTWSYPHVSVLLHNVGMRPPEFSQRTRSFLYGSLAGIAAQHLKIHDVRICDNGVVTLNLPPSGQSVGTTLSRSTHPGYIRRLEPLLRLLTEDAELTVKNTLFDLTKREVVELIAQRGCPELIQETVSCAHTERRTKGQPHCGLCTQCIDRRFATIAADLERHDLAERYEHDIFTSALKEGRDRAHAENYVRFAHELLRYSDSASTFFVERGGDLADALPEDHMEDFVRKVHDLFQRHQCDVHAVLTAQIARHAEALAKGDLPEHCLLRMTGASDVKTSPREQYVAKLAGLLSQALSISFQTNPPENERAMQDAGEAALKTADERFHREGPQMPFGSVSVRPDFSKWLDSSDALYIEFKLIKDKKDRNRVHGEIASDLSQYPSNCHLLFVVFDPKRSLADPSKLKDEVESRRANAVLVVVR